MTSTDLALATLAGVLVVVCAVLFYLWRHEQRIKELYWNDVQRSTREARDAMSTALRIAVAVRGVLDLSKDGELYPRSFAARRVLADLARDVIADANVRVAK